MFKYYLEQGLLGAVEQVERRWCPPESYVALNGAFSNVDELPFNNGVFGDDAGWVLDIGCRVTERELGYVSGCRRPLPARPISRFVRDGEVSIGSNLSNGLRMALKMRWWPSLAALGEMSITVVRHPLFSSMSAPARQLPAPGALGGNAGWPAHGQVGRTAVQAALARETGCFPGGHPSGHSSRGTTR
jgi:hypothetical protein